MKILKIGMFVICASFLVGCGGGDDEGSSGGEYSKMNCSAFGSQASAQAAYEKGAKQLDADNDGIACEDLK